MRTGQKVVQQGDRLTALHLRLEDALLCADPARAAGLVLPIPLDRREATFRPTFARVQGTLADYPTSVHAALLLIRAMASTDAAQAAAELGEQDAAGLDQRVLTLALADRLPTWIAELIWHLGEEVCDAADHRLVTIETLCVEWGLPRPSAPDYLFALVSALGDADASHGGGALAALLSADPGLCELIPDLLAAPGVGRVFARGSWAQAIAEVSSAGLIDRDSLLDLTLIHRTSDELDHQRWFHELHRELDPSDAEMMARSDAYLRLLADPQPEVKAAVIAGLYQRDARRPLPLDLVTQATSIILEAGSSAMVKAHLAWLKGAAQRHPGSAGSLALALSEAFGSADQTLVTGSLDAVLAILDVADIDVIEGIAEPLRQAASQLPPVLAERAVRAWGPLATAGTGRSARRQADTPAIGTTSSTAAGAACSNELAAATAPITARLEAPRHKAPRPAFVRPDSAPGRARTLPELAAAAEAFLVELDPQLGEVVLDAVAALAGRDLGATRAALAGLHGLLADAVQAGDQAEPALWLGERPVLAVLARLALPADHAVHGYAWRTPPGPIGCLTMRAQEVLSRALAGGTQELLALPTEASGEISPEALVQRIAAAAETGSAAWPMDVEQALLRAHRDLDNATLTEVVSALARINSRLARSVERRLRLGVLARPAIKVGFEAGRPRVIASTLTRQQDGQLTRQAFDLSLVSSYAVEGSALVALMALPHHREVTSAYLIGPLCASERRQLIQNLRALSLLGDARGRTGDATAAALLFGACLHAPEDRSAAVAALCRLTEDWFDAQACGRLWATAIDACPWLDLTKLAATLRDVVRQTSDPRLVWALLHALLDVLGDTNPSDDTKRADDNERTDDYERTDDCERAGIAELREIERSTAELTGVRFGRLPVPKQAVPVQTAPGQVLRPEAISLGQA